MACAYHLSSWKIEAGESTEGHLPLTSNFKVSVNRSISKTKQKQTKGRHRILSETFLPQIQNLNPILKKRLAIQVTVIKAQRTRKKKSKTVRKLHTT